MGEICLIIFYSSIPLLLYLKHERFSFSRACVVFFSISSLKRNLARREQMAFLNVNGKLYPTHSWAIIESPSLILLLVFQVIRSKKGKRIFSDL